MINKDPHPKGRVIRDVVAVFELDGCVANNNWRKARLAQDPQSYYEGAKDDPALEVGKALVKSHIDQGDFIIFASARPFATADATSKWIQDQFQILPFHDFTILMRRDGDLRPELELKAEFAQFILDYAQKQNVQIATIYDPNIEAVEVYRAAGFNYARVLDADGLQSPKVVPDSVTDVAFTDTPEAIRQDQPQPVIVNIGRAMSRLFPQGVMLRTEEDFNGHMAFMSTLAQMLKPE